MGDFSDDGLHRGPKAAAQASDTSQLARDAERAGLISQFPTAPAACFDVGGLGTRSLPGLPGPGPAAYDAHAYAQGFGKQALSQRPSTEKSWAPLQRDVREPLRQDAPDARAASPLADSSGLGVQKLSPKRSAPAYSFATSSRFT
jgi:hypothetical protein